MTKNRAQLARELFQIETDDEHEYRRKTVAIIGDLPFAEAKAVLDLVNQMRREELEQAQREFERMKRDRSVFDGLPNNLTLGEAAKIKAAAGDPVGKYLHEWFCSRQHRLWRALIRAAIAHHPGWKINANHTYTKLDPSAPDNDALIDWFQINYPKKARAIEDALGPMA